MVEEAGLVDKISVDSAGTSSYHVGEIAHSGTLLTLKKNNINYNGRARQFTLNDFDQFDYILAMDKSNLRDIRNLMPANTNAKVALFLDYADGISIREVPDPYYDGRFDEVYDLVYAASQGLLRTIRDSHNF